MREIKFRGKVVQDCNYKGKFIHGDFAYGDCIRPIENVGDDIIESYWLYDELAFVEVDPNTVGQFTGLKDKNGVEIYEGDIVKIVNNYNEATKKTSDNVVVKFKDGSFIVTWDVGEYEHYNHFTSYNTPIVTFEIIGNIHDKEEV